MTSKDRAELTVQLWEKTVDVQMHFNDLSLRIRSLAFTALTFTYGATFITLQKAKPIQILFIHGKRNPASIVVILGLFIWIGFWLMDAGWYHLLLRGSVEEGRRLEKELSSLGISANLTGAIRKASHTEKKKWPRKKKEMTALYRLNRFYLIYGLTLIALAVFCWIKGTNLFS